MRATGKKQRRKGGKKNKQTKRMKINGQIRFEIEIEIERESVCVCARVFVR